MACQLLDIEAWILDFEISKTVCSKEDENMKLISIVILALTTTTFSACIMVPEDECFDGDCQTAYGSIGFYWDFELYDTSLSSDCVLADVARVDIRIYNEYGNIEYSKQDCPCVDAGYDLHDFYPGVYEIQLTAYNPLRYLTHESRYEIEVYEGANDFGTLTLNYLSD
jgi:hypothetical protein